jgi:hypothetical protein
MQIRRSSRRRLVLNYVGTVFSAWPTVKFKVLRRIARLQCAQLESGESRGLDSRTARGAASLLTPIRTLRPRSYGFTPLFLCMMSRLLAQKHLTQVTSIGMSHGNAR